MRLINTRTLQLREFSDEPQSSGGDRPQYAILSHKWSDEETTFKDFVKARNTRSNGYRKVHSFCQRAFEHHGLDWAWADTCCVDKRSSAELTEAVNSMYRYYRQAEVCIAHLSDVQIQPTDHNLTSCRPLCAACQTTLESFRQSIWFDRGWTLQELIAPSFIVFIDENWNEIGSKTISTSSWMAPELSDITGVPADVLRSPSFVQYHSMAQRLSWASQRQTTRPEDLSYCLLGLLGVNMPLLYGEGGAQAWNRLQQTIIRRYSDESILAWGSPGPSADLPAMNQVVLAPYLGCFASCAEVAVSKPTKTVRPPYTIGNQGLEFRLKAGTAVWHPRRILAIPLHCYDYRKSTGTPCLLLLKEQECGHFDRINVYWEWSEEGAEKGLQGGSEKRLCGDETVYAHAFVENKLTCQI